MGDTSPSSGHLFWDDGTSIDTIESGSYIEVSFTGTEVTIVLSRTSEVK